MLFEDMHKFDMASVYRTSKSFESKFAPQTATEIRIKLATNFIIFRLYAKLRTMQQMDK